MYRPISLKRPVFGMTKRILSISDTISDVIYSPRARARFADTDLVISCGDLPYYYVEYVVSMLDTPVFFVRGNHAKLVEYGNAGERTHPHGAINLHRRVVRRDGLLLAGVEGSVRYSRGPFQYTQQQMWMHVFHLVPSLLANRLLCGRFLDIFVTHAPPWGIHDMPDWPHQGIRAFRWLLEVFKPTYHFHGHIHLYGPKPHYRSRFEETTIINTYGYRYLELELPA